MDIVSYVSSRMVSTKTRGALSCLGNAPEPFSLGDEYILLREPPETETGGEEPY